ncbi:uncharacterized protein N7496_003018 [Penicillium cataractarum]|uniref:Protein kinase domain-containing protein n=1 Tax=Penicillium cataractarum TaxID=2100454 RepID=A0A9W9VIF1_9EURO|nr:uncharacterized protein N7496_003018 [Penicillium cataractarum]KAJ5380590.1 hypothetical protein N7496_003018 [Penicillium cataractarum]
MSDSYDDILNSLDDDNNYYSIDGDNLSPSLQAWSNSNDIEELDLDSLNLSSDSDSSWVDPLESAITATRNGSAPILSTLSQFTTILSQTGVHGPRLLKAGNLSARATKIGAGAQFTVFEDPIFQGEVVKRVNVPLTSRAGQRFAASNDYRLQLKTLELEILSLCNPVLRAHPNITSLLAWGFDFPYANLAVPVLFMEAALMPLGDFLSAESRSIEVRYQFALDIANGLEALHHLKIVHGDVKPDNVLVFAGQSESVPFQAKLSDFGVCVDLEAPDGKFSLSDYRGTPAWLAPELISGDISKFGQFSPELMFQFDAYSFGLVLLSIFTGNGQIPSLDKTPEKVPDQVSKFLNSQKDISSDMRMELRKGIMSLLAENPRDRKLPSPSLLKIDSPAYASWLASIQSSSAGTHVGIIDPIYNKGPLFWYRLDESIRSELEAQYLLGKDGNAPPFGGNVLFGIAQTITGAKPSYLDRMLTYLGDAAKAGFSPARAIYAQIMKAHNQPLEFSEEELKKWMLQAVSEGYFFVDSRYSQKDIEKSRDQFRRQGGFCSDPFLAKKDIKAAVVADKALEWITNNGIVVDRKGNTILHAAAALGVTDVVQELLDSAQVAVDVENDDAETPLYKAFQAGHTDVIEILLDGGASACTKTRQNVTPLHWLFMVPDSSIDRIAKLMIKGGADINAVITPVVKETSGGYPEKIQIFHYPFELPHGTPLHWACFFRNMAAMDALLSLGANINACYHGLDASSTPLALTAYFGEPEIARYLISHGADGTLLDSMGRNTLHAITKYFPDRHGYLPYHWHYWIRHGPWEQHLTNMTDLVQVLIEAGADINAKDKGYPPLTPIAAAADLGVWDGGMICALLNAGADLKESILSAGDTILHSWVSIVGPRLDYPEAYLPTLKKIVDAMPNIDIRNRFQEDTPLHLLATTYHPEDEFEEACDILLNNSTPVDINTKTRHGEIPLSIALETNLDPIRRGRFLLEKGADPLILHARERDIFYSIANNVVITDQASCDLIETFLLRLGSDTKQAYKKHYLSNANSHETLIAAASRGKSLTVQLLLSVGLVSHINKADTSKSPPWTALDQALHSAEISRRLHIQHLASYKAGAARANALEAKLVYDSNQGPPTRAAEAYRCFPEVIRILRDSGAKRTCEIERLSNGDYISQPREWDEEEIAQYGFTPDTQPNREVWQGLYDLAKYSGRGWLGVLTGGRFGS